MDIEQIVVVGFVVKYKKTTRTVKRFDNLTGEPYLIDEKEWLPVLKDPTTHRFFDDLDRYGMGYEFEFDEEDRIVGITVQRGESHRHTDDVREFAVCLDEHNIGRERRKMEHLFPLEDIRVFAFPEIMV